MPPPLANQTAIAAALAQLRGWRRIGAWLRCGYRLPSFMAAVRLTEQMAGLAEKLDHHPEWTVRYRAVEVATTTHDRGNLTSLDLDLARGIAALAVAAGAEVLTGVAAADSRGLWVPAGHFYSPITDVAELAADADRRLAQGFRDLAGIDLRLPEQLALVRELARFYGDEGFPDQPEPGRRYCLANDYFPYGDAFAYYALLRHLRPRRVIEVGAGWSSAVLLDTDERFLGNRIECTFIEPYPDRLLSLLTDADVSRTRLLRCRLQDVDLAEFDALAAGDILFIDSSHVVKTGSDVHHALFEVLPRLAPGVWVHFHDVHANFEYPEAWIREGRSWNEAYFLRAFLMHNREWEIALHGATLAECAAAELLPLMPRVGTNVGGSLWLRRND